jgi:carbonic anhydrase
MKIVKRTSALTITVNLLYVLIIFFFNNMKAHTSETQSSITPTKALAFLQEGNERFVNNLKVNRNLLQQANDTRDGQFPFAVMLSCIDSRTSAELIFDQGLGDIFSIRIAGSVVNTDIIGSLEFACKVSGSKLIVVLGHTKCGAIKGACDHVEMGNLTELLSKIQPAVYQESLTTDPSQRNSKNASFVENVNEINIKNTVEAILSRSTILSEMVARNEIGIVGGKHDLDTGKVTFFEHTMHGC